MRYLVFLLPLLLLAAPRTEAQNAAASQPAGEEDQARAAAEAWLALLDAGDYEKSWEAASPLFQQQVTVEQWRQAGQQVREPLGDVKTRTLASAEIAAPPPNAPEGEYMVMRFNSSFFMLPEADEVVVLRKSPEGQWKTVGYFVRPAQ